MTSEVPSLAPARSKHQYHRSVLNLLLQPFVQLRIGFVTIGTALLFVLFLASFFYLKLMQFTDVIVTLTQADQEIHALLGNYLESIAWTAVGGAIVFVIVNLLLTIYLTHKMVGPTIAFRRHINALMEGNFSAKIRLRRGDAFEEVAEDLNRLSEWLKNSR